MTKTIKQKKRELPNYEKVIKELKDDLELVQNDISKGIIKDAIETMENGYKETLRTIERYEEYKKQSKDSDVVGG